MLLEAGAASGRQPTETVQLRSYLSMFLEATGVSLGSEDETPFPMRLLHFRRTFVEKMFAIHSKVELLKRDGKGLGSYARHYYDLFKLSQRPEVVAMLDSDEYREIKDDYDAISRTHFPNSYFFPENMAFSQSEALFPAQELAEELRAEYAEQCDLLCFGSYPTWDEVMARFVELRGRL